MIDGTVGAGGHAAGWLQGSAPDGELLGLDRDPHALEVAASRLRPFGARAHLRQGSFAELKLHAGAVGWEQVRAVLLDLGISSMQLSDAGRGFSFRQDGPLDMRLDPGQELTAEELVNAWSEGELADIIWRYGEEPQARRVASAILRARPIRGTQQLAETVGRAIGGRRRRIHPATRTFQALRIAVNDELQALRAALPQAVELLQAGGRLAVISFHSLEDRIVKRFLREQGGGCTCPPEQPFCTCDRQARLRELSRKPLRPDEEEVRANPRARSARLRVAMRLELA